MRQSLSEASARRIVEHIGPLMQRALLVARPDGRILAASNGALVGHTLDLRTQELLPPETADTEQKGEPPVWGGTLLPVLADGDVACVVGILGGSDGPQDSRKILSAMTALLFAEEQERDAVTVGLDDMDRFLEDWLFSTVPADNADLEQKGRQLGLDVNRTRTAGVLLIRDRDTGADTPPVPPAAILPRIRDLDGVGKSPLSVTVGSRIVVLFDTDSAQTAKGYLRAVQTAVEGAFPVYAYGGTGIPSKTFSGMRASVREAERSARSALRMTRRDVMGFDEIPLELFLLDVPSPTSREFCRRMFQGIPEQEREASIHLLSVYFDNDASLNRTADILGIHKNTVQYRLRRLQDWTGRDPRRLQDALPLYLATVLQDIRSI